MKVRIDGDATSEEADAIAVALTEQAAEPVEVYIGDASEPAAREAPDSESDATSESTADQPAPDAGATNGEATPTGREQALLDEIAAIHEGGPKRYRDGLAEQNKLFVRDRLERWFGEDGLTFEDGTFANHDADDQLSADGLLTGGATLEGRSVHVMANDYTVKAGSIASHGVEKFIRLQERALKTGRPLLALVDSAGGRIDEQRGFFANREGIGKFYYNHARLSGRVPQICVLYGPCIAGAAYTPVFADFTIMVDGMSALAVASPRMVEMVTGEEISLEALGGPDVHAEHSGSADLVARDEEHARELATQLLGYLPDNAEERPPENEPAPPEHSPEGIDSIVPAEPDRPYDVLDVLNCIADEGSVFELRSEYGSEILTAFCRIDGRAVAVVANQPATRAGAIFPDAARKAAEFVWTADAYNVPLLYLCDTPGFMAGSQVEKEGILEAGKKLIYATSCATVPKQCVVLRKAYGAGIYAMSGPAYDPEATLALPGAEVAIMGPEAAINAVYRNELDDIEDEAERQARIEELQEAYREDIDVHRLASEVVIDEIVPPSDLRAQLASRFEFYDTVEKDLPERKHGTVL